MTRAGSHGRSPDRYPAIGELTMATHQRRGGTDPARPRVWPGADGVGLVVAALIWREWLARCTGCCSWRRCRCPSAPRIERQAWSARNTGSTAPARPGARRRSTRRRRRLPVQRPTAHAGRARRAEGVATAWPSAVARPVGGQPRLVKRPSRKAIPTMRSTCFDHNRNNWRNTVVGLLSRAARHCGSISGCRRHES